MKLGEGWKLLTEIGHEASIVFVVIAVILLAVLYVRHRRRKARHLR